MMSWIRFIVLSFITACVWLTLWLIVCRCWLSLTICHFPPSVPAHYYSIHSAVFYLWQLNGSKWKVDTNNTKFAEGGIVMYHWDMKCLGMVKTATTTNIRVNHWKLTRWHVYYMQIWCIKTGWKSMKIKWKQSQTCLRVHRSVWLRNIMFGYG